MKLDIDYLKGLLEAIEATPDPIFTIRTPELAGFRHNEPRFVFHMGLLHDKGLVSRENGQPGIGLLRGADLSTSWSVVPLRLTAQGHDFLHALRNKEVWTTIKKDFKEGSITAIVDTAKKLVEAYSTKKIETLLKGEGFSF